MSLLEAKNIRKIYKTRFGGAAVEALKNASFSVEQGEYVAIMGPSGWTRQLKEELFWMARI